MLFNSLNFLIFFVIFFVITQLTSSTWRWLVLLAASYLFYFSWQPVFIVLLLFCTIITYAVGLGINRAQIRQTKHLLLWLALSANLGPLAFFKYVGFLNETLRSLFALLHIIYPAPSLNILLPVGISFYSFQALSYCFDIYQGREQPESHFGRFALYMAFFPKLISGPIERPANLLPQLKKIRTPDSASLMIGARLFMWGLFKKIVIADRLGIYVDMVFNNPQDFHGKTMIVAAWFFTIQIYCDFSAYTDMALGCGRLLGIDLSQNFRFPYFARSIQDFWRRWHISLTSWFRDYLYFPLGGNRCSRNHWLINIMIVFVVSGLWHGAAWTFVCWGALHGVFYLLEQATAGVRKTIYDSIGLKGLALQVWEIFATFNLITLAWVFFRANTIQNAIYIISHMFTGLTDPLRLGPSAFTTIVTTGLLGIFIGVETLLYLKIKWRIAFSRPLPFALQYPAYAIVLVTIFLFGISRSQFIYFHF